MSQNIQQVLIMVGLAATVISTVEMGKHAGNRGCCCRAAGIGIAEKLPFDNLASGWKQSVTTYFS